MIIVKNKRSSIEKIKQEYPGCHIFDVTSKGEMQKLSPFYPHGGIPVPFSGTVTSASVEGVWQGLKVFEHEGIDWSSFSNRTMRNLKRTVRTHGRCLGHQKGLGGHTLLGYIEARKLIYVPTYKWMLENKCQKVLEPLRKLNEQGETIVLLDYDTNGDVNDASKPLSHASLIKAYLEGKL